MDHEAEILLRFLNGERDHVLGILEGFSEAQLRRPVLPSGWSCLGLVKHLALADEPPVDRHRRPLASRAAHDQRLAAGPPAV